MNKIILSAQIIYTMGTSLFLATYILWFEELGLSLQDMATIDIVFNLGILLFEVPTGVVADRFGRRTSFILSCIVRGIALVGLAFQITAPEIAALFFVAAIGETLVSGASGAWLISNLREEARVRDVYRMLIIIGGVTTIIAGATGAVIYNASAELMWITSGTLLGLAGLLAAFAPEGAQKEKDEVPLNIVSILCQTKRLGVRLLKASPLVRVMVVQSAAVAGAGLFWQLVVVDSTLPWAAGAVWVVFALSSMGGGWAARFAPENTRTGLFLLALSIALLIPVGLLGMPWIALAFFVFHIALQSFAMPNLWEDLNAQIEERVRASALSVISLVTSLAGVIGLYGAGLLGDAYGPEITFSFPATIGSLVVILVVASRHSSEKSP